MRSLPSDLMAKVKQSLQTLGSNGQPKLKIAASRAKSTVTDANYWTVETIRTKTNLGDISVVPRRMKNSGGPDRLYEIHVDDGQVSTAVREYPDRLRQGWQPQFSLGSGSSVAIAFDGYWERNRKLWRLVTERHPWIFWVDSTGILWRQHWTDVNTKVQMDTQVIRVKAIRAWKEIGGGQNDQGLVVAYIKTNGSVWYRNYCIQADGSYMWENERQILGFSGAAVELGLFLTHDYRMGIVIENASRDIWWMVTHRTWVGMATPNENIMAGIRNSTFEIIPLEYTDMFENEHISTGIVNSWFNIAEPIYPTILSIGNPNKSPTEIRLKFSHLLSNDLNNVGLTFSFKDSLNREFAILSTNAGVDHSEIVFILENFNGVSGSMTLIYDRTILELDCMNQGSKFAIESFNLEFQPDLVPPEGYISDYINVGLNTQFVLTDVYWREGYDNENLIAGLQNNLFVVTKVGSNPL